MLFQIGIFQLRRQRFKLQFMGLTCSFLNHERQNFLFLTPVSPGQISCLVLPAALLNTQPILQSAHPASNAGQPVPLGFYSSGRC